MRKEKGFAAIAAIGIIVISFTLAAFFLLEIEHVSVNIWALTFLLLSESVLFGGIILLRNIGTFQNKVFLRAGVTVSLSLYFLATLICSLFSGALINSLNTFILMNIAIIAFVSITLTSIISLSHRIGRNNLDDFNKIGTKEPKRGGF